MHSLGFIAEFQVLQFTIRISEIDPSLTSSWCSIYFFKLIICVILLINLLIGLLPSCLLSHSDYRYHHHHRHHYHQHCYHHHTHYYPPHHHHLIITVIITIVRSSVIHQRDNTPLFLITVISYRHF